MGRVRSISNRLMIYIYISFRADTSLACMTRMAYRCVAGYGPDDLNDLARVSWGGSVLQITHNVSHHADTYIAI